MKKLVLSLAVACSLISAQAAVYTFDADLSGLTEAPPNASPGLGYALFHYDDVANTLHMNVLFGRLVGTTTSAHIHAPTDAPFTGTAGVATTVPTFVGFPTGVNFGSYEATLDLTSADSYNPAFITANGGTTAGAQSALVAAMFSGRSYLNIHTTAFPGGEVRGFLTLIPEPSSFALISVAAAVLALRRRMTH